METFWKLRLVRLSANSQASLTVVNTNLWPTDAARSGQHVSAPASAIVEVGDLFLRERIARPLRAGLPDSCFV
jgi:hypothetical protein